MAEKKISAKQKAEHKKKVKEICNKICRLNKELATLSKELESHMMDLIEV